MTTALIIGAVVLVAAVLFATRNRSGPNGPGGRSGNGPDSNAR